MTTNTYALYQQGQGKIYIINGYSLGQFYIKKFLTNIGISLGHLYKKNSHKHKHFYKKNSSEL